MRKVMRIVIDAGTWLLALAWVGALFWAMFVGLAQPY